MPAIGIKTVMWVASVWDAVNMAQLSISLLQRIMVQYSNIKKNSTCACRSGET